MNMRPLLGVERLVVATKHHPGQIDFVYSTTREKTAAATAYQTARLPLYPERSESSAKVATVATPARKPAWMLEAVSESPK